MAHARAALPEGAQNKEDRVLGVAVVAFVVALVITAFIVTQAEFPTPDR